VIVHRLSPQVVPFAPEREDFYLCIRTIAGIGYLM
jgi:hypothetical protein